MFLHKLLGKSRPTGARFGYAVVGLGHIAGYFLEALRDSPLCAVTALVSGDPAKSAKLAKKYKVASTYSYGDFDSIRDNPDIHAVYIALPVDQHREYTLRAAAAGKHVLCEKPMAPNVADAQAMVNGCREAGVRLSIAYRCPHSSMHRRLQELVRGGALGPASSLKIESGFGFELHPGWRDNPQAGGGGSLWDVGIYPLNAARFLLREEPLQVREARAEVDANGLEREIQWTSVFPSGAQATCESSYLRKIPDTLSITGERGHLVMAPAFSHRERYILQGEYRSIDKKTVTIHETAPASEPSEFRLEAEALAIAYGENRDTITPGSNGLADMVAMEAIYKAAGVPLS